ncbi:protein tyrosine phosphatase [Pantoea sp. B65]|uniref:arsenate reductase/protein-tyrosine-phosphatase family protein n=1 Tax=Pantoea sp. B65 TaxID=2813359 RepID=UPI0039B3D045
MFNSILVVCVGNICRSPTGERLLKQYLPDKNISSAGINALVDHHADETAMRVAEKNGVSLVGHMARQITSRMCYEHDLILVMEKKHIKSVEKISPESKGKIMLFGHWDKDVEIYDPYRKNDEFFDGVFGMLNNSAKKWAKVLS